jgi:hypothetical protein
MISRALAKKVHTKGSERIQTPPIIVYKPKKAITESRKSIQ